MKTWNEIAIFLDEPTKSRLKERVPDIYANWVWHGDRIVLARNDGPNPDKTIESLSDIFKSKKSFFKSAIRSVCIGKGKVARIEIYTPERIEPRQIILHPVSGVFPQQSSNIPEDIWEKAPRTLVCGIFGYTLNGKIHQGKPLTGDGRKAYSAIHGFDFPKVGIMQACRREGLSLTEEQYYKAENAMRKAFVEAIIKEKISQ